MRDTVTTALDVLGLLLIAAGLVVFLWPYIEGLSLVCAGGLVLAVSLSTALRNRPGADR